MNTPEELRQMQADQAQADAAARREFLSATPGEGLTADTAGSAPAPVVPPSGPVSGLHWMGT